MPERMIAGRPQREFAVEDLSRLMDRSPWDDMKEAAQGSQLVHLGCEPASPARSASDRQRARTKSERPSRVRRAHAAGTETLTTVEEAFHTALTAVSVTSATSVSGSDGDPGGAERE